MQRLPNPRSDLLSVAVVPADAGSVGDIFLTQSDTSLCEPLHSAEADVLTSKGSVASMKDSGVLSGRGGGESSLSQQFAVGDGELCPAIDMGDTFLTGWWSPW